MLRRSYLDGATSWLHRAWVPSPARRPRSQRCSARSCLRSPFPCSAPLAAVCRHRAWSAPRLHRRVSRRRSATSAATMRCARLIFRAGYRTRLRWPRHRTRPILAVSVSRTLTRWRPGRRLRSDQDAGSRAAQRKGCTVWTGCCDAADDGCARLGGARCDTAARLGAGRSTQLLSAAMSTKEPPSC